MRGRVIREKLITRQMVIDAPNTIWVFGDNMMRQGYGGQAREMRGEVNAVGVPTKWRPDNMEGSFFTNQTFETDPIVRTTVDLAFVKMQHALDNGRDVVIPADGLGTGLADLKNRAPAVLAYIEAWIRKLEDHAT